MRPFRLQRRLRGGARGDPILVGREAGKGRQIDVELVAPGQHHEKIGIGDAEAIAGEKQCPAEMLVDIGKALDDLVLRLGLRRFGTFSYADSAGACPWEGRKIHFGLAEISMANKGLTRPHRLDASRWLYWIALGVGLGFAGLYALGSCALGVIC